MEIIEKFGIMGFILIILLIMSLFYHIHENYEYKKQIINYAIETNRDILIEK